MLRAALFSLVASVLVPVLAVQVSLQSSYPGQDILGDIIDPTEWNLDKSPNPDNTDHLVFETVYSLLQYWPNTRMRNGHNIIPGVIPEGTLLYHGTRRSEVPSHSDWVAFDPEFSYFFCRENLTSSDDTKRGCWHLTLATTRPLNIVYFDGSSAAKHPYGPVDTQDLIVWGESRLENLFRDSKRIKYLCAWGEKFGVDGFVRMQRSFEVMLCDFTSGVSVVTFVNLEPAKGIPPDMSELPAFEAVNAGFRHSRFPGETRIQLDLTRLVSFYDTELVPSLVAIRDGQERWDHRAANLSSEDLSAVKSRLEAALMRTAGPTSGIDWRTLMQVIVDRFAQRLELMRHLLNSAATAPDEILDLANKAQTQLRIMLAPYILLSATPTDPSDKTEVNWTKPVYKLCATTYTSAVESKLHSMTDSEKLLLRAVRGTSREICRVVTKMWTAGVHAGIDPSLNTKKSFDTSDITRVRSAWVEDLDRLMTWLDWSVWVKCNPDCDPEEMCYLPTWPIGFPSFRRKRGELSVESFTKDMWDAINPEPDEWTRPQPKCIRRADPYGF